MLLAIREKVTGAVALVIIAALGLFMVVPMLYDYVAGMGDNSAITVDGESVSIQQYNQRLSQNRQRLTQAFGGELPESFGDQLLAKRTTDQFIQQLLQEQATLNDGYAISDEDLVRVIQEAPQFQTDGQFDPEAYKRQLRSIGYSPALYEQTMTKRFVQGQFQEGITQTAFVAPGQLEQMAALMHQERDIEYIAFSGEAFRSDIELSDAEIEAYFEDHREQFMHPEKVSVEYVAINFEDYKNGLEVTEEEVQQEYQAGVDSGRYTSQEERSASHILFAFDSDADEDARAAVRSEAEQVLTQINEGGDFSALAKEHSDDPGSAEQGGSLGVVQKGVMVPEFEQAVFNLPEEGAVSDLVESQFGYHIIRLDEYTPAEAQPFDEISAKIRQELLDNKARLRYDSDIDEMSNLAFESSGSLEPVAQALSLELQSSDWFTRTSGEGIASDPVVREAAFKTDILDDGYNSGTLDLSNGDVVVLRVKEHEPRHEKTLEEARSDVESALMTKTVAEQLSAAQSQAAEAWRSGESGEAIAERLGGEFNTALGVTRKNPEQLPRGLIQVTFKMAMGEAEASVANANLSGEDRAVVKLLDKRPGQWEQLTQSEQEQIKQQLLASKGGMDYAAVLNQLREEADIDINQSLIDQSGQ
ncbi:peptidyl-prolyl cis-trans isomerase D, putative [gamma proteobacterium HTCC5015]|nr:peptidyl-prolyl cis-trans isomerase D, putative [gamma proteobacterium HTCC5015]